MAHTYGIILFDGFELLDVFGPAEAFGMVKHFDAATRLLMITHDGEPATSASCRSSRYAGRAYGNRLRSIQ